MAKSSASAGDKVDQVRPGDRVTTHSLLLREQGAWAEQVRLLTDGGVDAAANAARSGAAQAVKAVRDGGRLATITSDPPAAERDITVRAVQVVPDGRRLSGLVQLLAQGTLAVSVGERFSLERGAAALAQVRRGAHGTVIVLRPRPGTAFRPRREHLARQARPVGRDLPAPDALLANVPVQQRPGQA